MPCVLALENIAYQPRLYIGRYNNALEEGVAISCTTPVKLQTSLAQLSPLGCHVKDFTHRLLHLTH